MSKENAIQLLEKLLENKHVLQYLNTKAKPADKDALLKIYTEIARESGEGISADDIAEAFETIEEERRQRTEAVMADISEIDDDQLEYVTGGDGSRCWFNENDAVLECRNGVHKKCGFTHFLGGY